MAFETRKYLILNTGEIDLVNFNQVLETSTETLRTSVDGTKTFVKWDGLEPEFAQQIESRQGPYSHAEILEILSGEEWTEPMDEEDGISS